MNNRRVLVVDDDLTFLNLMCFALEKDGYKTSKASSGSHALEVLRQEKPDAILLDIMMPDMDGFELCKRIAPRSDAVILFVSALGQTEDIIQGFQVGGDDYIVKPFDFIELLERLKACLRRKEQLQDPDIPLPTVDAQPNWRIDTNRRRVLINGCYVQLTAREFHVLHYLYKNQGRIMSINAILSNVWGPEYIGDRSLVKQFIYRLRNKLETNPSEPRFLLTVHGSGYLFEQD